MMIYQHATPFILFDEKIIKSFDQVVSWVSAQEPNDQAYHLLNRLQYIREYKTVYSCLPRRSGKTFYLNQVFNHLLRTGASPLMIVPRRQNIPRYESNTQRWVSASACFDSYMGRMRGNEYTHLLFDEVHPKGVDPILKNLSMVHCLNNIEMIIGLYT